MEARLVVIESRYEDLARQLDELNRVVYEQQKAIERLERELRAVRLQIQAGDDARGDEPPPHY